MKILVVSLLRLGDLVLQTPALTALKRRFPRAELHLLTNDCNHGMVDLLPQVDQVHYFPRALLQKGLCSIDTPTTWAPHYLTEFVAGLNTQGFHLAVNLTHNRLSGHLMNMIDADEKEGLLLAPQALPFFGSKWFRYLNSFSTVYRGPRFHYADIYQWAVGSEISHPFELCETQAGQAEAERFAQELGEKKFIAIQAFTSDIKKNWLNTHWSETIFQIQSANPNLAIVLLGAPAERERLEQINNRNIAIIATPTLAGALSILKRASYLISVDTSIKHLAAAVGLKTLELSLGSSDFRSTGTYLPGSHILSSKEACAPCPHSARCSRLHHDCSISLQPDLVASVFQAVLVNDTAKLVSVAQKHQDSVNISRVESSFGFWMAAPILEKNKGVHDGIELASWKRLIDRPVEDSRYQYGELGFQIKKETLEVPLDSSACRTLESRLIRSEAELMHFVQFLRRSPLNESELAERVDRVEARLQCGPIFSTKVKECDTVFTLKRGLTSVATEMTEMIQTQLRILREIQLVTEAP